MRVSSHCVRTTVQSVSPWCLELPVVVVVDVVIMTLTFLRYLLSKFRTSKHSSETEIGIHCQAVCTSPTLHKEKI